MARHSADDADADTSTMLMAVSPRPPVTPPPVPARPPVEPAPVWGAVALEAAAAVYAQVVVDHDGAAGNPVRRAEPKVRAATIASLLTPLVLVLLAQYAPWVSVIVPDLAGYVQAAIAAVVTAVVTFVSGYLARAVNRIDLFSDAGQ